MPGWITLLGVVLIIGLCCFALVTVFKFLWNRNSGMGKPRFGLFAGNEPGTLGFWVDWNPRRYHMTFYRLRLLRVSPGLIEKESRETFSLPVPQASPFSQIIKLSDSFIELLSSDEKRALVTFELRSTEENALFHDFPVSKLRRIYEGKSVWGGRGALKKNGNKLDVIEADGPLVTSLDYDELIERKKKLQELEAAAQAKLEKKKPVAAKPAAKEPQESTQPESSSQADSETQPAEKGGREVPVKE